MHRLNGVAVEGSLAPFDLTDRGLTLGDGLFETIAVFGGKVAFSGSHVSRLVTAAEEIGLRVDRDALLRELIELLNGAETSDAVIRLTVTRGSGARGLAIPDASSVNVISALSPYPKSALNAPIRLATSLVRRNPTSFASRAKTLSYLDNVLAFDAAKRQGADDALMLNTDGRIACTSMANLFAVIGDELVTPPVSEGVMPGIMRELVLHVAPGTEIKPVERPIDVAELLAADAVFATNSVRLVMPVIAIDGQPTRTRSVVDWISTIVSRQCGAA